MLSMAQALSTLWRWYAVISSACQFFGMGCGVASPTCGCLSFCPSSASSLAPISFLKSRNCATITFCMASSMVSTTYGCGWACCTSTSSKYSAWSGVGAANAAAGCCALGFGCRALGGALSLAGGALLLLGLFFGLPFGLGPFVGLSGAALHVDFLCSAILVSEYFS